ncbi:hypothetical protein CO667_32680 [Rhizobium sp. L43]|nr:hypothetical protein CO667_32680 [Rhizobium sp. L43]
MQRLRLWILGSSPRKTECGGAFTASTACAAVLLEFLQTSRLLLVFAPHLRMLGHDPSIHAQHAACMLRIAL